MGVLEVALSFDLVILNDPLNDADTESLEKSIRSTVATGAVGEPPLPPPNQP